MASSALQFAFVGIGPMGQGISQNLIAKGNLAKPLLLWNRTKQRAVDFSAEHGKSVVVDTLEEIVAQGDIIWSCLQNEDAVLETYGKILASDIKGKLFVESSTISSVVTNKLAAQIIEAGAEFVALPVFGEPSMAKMGILTMIPAGKPESVERILPYLAGVTGRAVVNLGGEEPGQASLLKFIGNVLIMTSMETAAEMNVFAEKTNLGPHNILKLFESLMPMSPHVVYTKHMLSGGYFKEAGPVPVSHALHLTSRVLEVAKSTGTSLKSYEVVVDHLKDLQEQEGPSANIMGIYGAVRKESGLPFKNE